MPVHDVVGKSVDRQPGAGIAYPCRDGRGSTMTNAFLHIPPFPGHRARPLAVPTDAGSTRCSECTGDDLAATLRRWKVGGTFWGPCPPIEPDRDVVVCASNPAALPALLDAARQAGVADRVVLRAAFPGDHGVPRLPAQGDPWHMCAKATLVIADAQDEAALVARLAGANVHVIGEGRFAPLRDSGALGDVLLAQLAGRWTYRDPFRNVPLALPEAIAMLGKWRSLIEANREIGAIYGVARWKRVTSDALLWDGTGPVRHARPAAAGASQVPSGSLTMAWMARTDTAAMEALAARGVRVGEIEDGMIRSTGLGANCVPPLSIVVDAAGAHFDPAQASGLETILQTTDIGEDLRRRAANLREILVDAGISKYGSDSVGARPGRSAAGRRTVLVTGQVEDDRSVLKGGAGLDNLELLRRTRQSEPDARIIFKPHPDVEAGHRKGRVPDARALAFADEIDRTSSIAALLREVDAIHVITSLAGFEALMRGCEVVTHGVPFYAGWGLTRDLGPVPARRTRRRSLDELVAATLILYPRYVDPVTRLPCEPELLVERIAEGKAQVSSPLIVLRELQGRLNRLMQGKERR